MNTYEIDVNLVNAAGPAKGKALQVDHEQMEIYLSNRSGKVENALVTWRFRHLPAGLTPVITFDSRAVIASGPTTTLGAIPQVTFEIRFPLSAKPNRRTYLASYTISASSGSDKAIPPPVLEGPSLVVVRSPDPPDGGARANESSHAEA